MEKIILTQDQIEVIQQDLRGEISLNATEWQRKHLSEVMDMAEKRLLELDADDGGDLIRWFWNEYQKQQNYGKE